MTANLALWAVADLMWTLHYNHVADPPFPNLSDAFYLATYPCAYVGLVLLLRSRLRPVRASLWLDGAVSGLTLAAVATALLFAPLLSATDSDPTTVAVSLAYPVGDLLLFCLVGVALGITGWRPGRAWGLIALSLLLTGVADAVYSYLESSGTYADGSILSTCWPASVLAMGVAAWQPAQPRPRAPRRLRRADAVGLRRDRRRRPALRLGGRPAPAGGRARRRGPGRRDGARRPDPPRERRPAPAQSNGGADRRAQRARQPAPADERPRRGARLRDDRVRPDAGVLRSRRVQGLQRRLRPQRGRRTARPAGPRPGRVGHAAPARRIASAATSSASCSTARRPRRADRHAVPPTRSASAARASR